MVEETIQENQTNQPVLEQAPVKVEKKKINPLTIAILLIAILLIVAGAIYAGMQIGKKQTPSVIPPQTESPTLIPTRVVQPTSAVVIPTTITPDETVNWKTYIDKEGKYSIKYPNVFNINKWGDDQLGKLTQNVSVIDLIERDAFNAQISINVSSTENAKIDAQSRIDSGDGERFLLEKINAYRWYGKQKTQALVVAIAGNYSYVFTLECLSDQCFKSNKEYYINAFDQILSTFKFLE